MHVPWRALGVIVLIAVVLGGATALTYAPWLRLGEIAVAGVDEAHREAVAAAVREEFSGSWMFLPRDSIVVVSKDEIAAVVAREFPSMKNIRVARVFPNGIRIAADERELWGMYCTRTGAAGDRGQCAYLDRDGTAFEEVAGVSGWLLPVIYGSSHPRAGERLIANETVQLFEAAAVAIGRTGGGLLTLELATATPGDLVLGLADGWELWVAETAEPAHWMGILTVLLENEIKNRATSLEYVDLRFGNKVFYKYR